MKSTIVLILFFTLGSSSLLARQITIHSPNKKIEISLACRQKADNGEWYMKVSFNNNGKASVVIPAIELGLLRSDQDFSKELKLLKAGKPLLINEQYTAVHGKRSICSNTANETVIAFENKQKGKMNVIIRAYNDGVAFRYEFPGKQGTYVIKDELTAYTIPAETMRWMEKWNTANERTHSAKNNEKGLSHDW